MMRSIADPRQPDDHPLLSIRDLTVSFPDEHGDPRPVVDGLDLTVYPRQTVALVGESGCGKSVTALSVARLLDEPPGRIERGRIDLGDRDLLALSRTAVREIRGETVGMIFQEPTRALNPVISVGEQLIETCRRHRTISRSDARRNAVDIMAAVGITAPERRLSAFPHELSGGLCQRVMIALALAAQPRLLIADEPTTALDVTIQMQILDLLHRLRQTSGMGILFITHDLGVVARIADVVCVMYAGRVMEYASVDELFRCPMHPYTRGLLSSVPRLDARVERLRTVAELIESAASETSDGALRPWIAHRDGGERYRLIEAASDHWVASSAAPDAPADRPPDLAFRREAARHAEPSTVTAAHGV
jgi:ABC-type dipeptide/oligopeptide/nickel transport system ATPase component